MSLRAFTAAGMQPVETRAAAQGVCNHILIP